MTIDQLQKQDDDQLRMLAIAFRVVGGLCALCVNFAWLHVFAGFAMMFGSGTMAVASNTPKDPSIVAGTAFGTAFGGAFAFIGLLVIASGFAMGYFGFRTAKNLETRQNWKLCFGVSIAIMLFQPLGLVLGIFSIIVLNRASVRQLFPPA